MHLRASSLAEPSTAAEKDVTRTYIRGLGVSAARVVGTNAADDTATTAYLNTLNVHAGSLSGVCSTAEGDTTETYLNGLHLRASSLTEPSTAAEKDVTRTYIRDLGVSAARVVGTNAADDTANTAYLNTLNIQAGSFSGNSSLQEDTDTRAYITRLGVTASRLTSTDAGDQAVSKGYIETLDVDARSAKRLRLDVSAAMSSGDVTSNSEYVRHVIGVETRRRLGSKRHRVGETGRTSTS